LIDYKINYTENVKSSDLESGIFICVLHANKIPPHIGISSDGLFFSLKVNGKDENIRISKLVDILEKRDIKSLFFKLKNYEIKSIDAVFSQYKLIVPGESNCLSPIVKCLQLKPDFENISELLKFLQEKNKVESIFGLNLPKDYKGIPKYSKEDITKRIVYLKNAKGSQHIS
jgi:hypothetical protein